MQHAKASNLLKGRWSLCNKPSFDALAACLAVKPMLGSADLHNPMHLSSAYKPCSATFLQPRAGTVLVGYMRVSTSEQNLALQRDALAGAGCDRFYEDICSGSVTERPGLSRALDHLRSGDALVVWKLDRIGRSLGHVVELVDGLQSKGIGLKVLTGGIDTTSSTGRLVFGIFATLAEFERDLIKERTMAGLAAARARGRTGGRPRLMTRAKLRTAMTMMADRSNVAADVAEQLGVSISTLYAYVDGEGHAKPRARKLLSR